ncbi:MAG: ferredoxin-NADP reductase [Omnitrophica WOR_2 bacterium SM23_72]|nr:MAG: ferredoxin-NADP reductase [Omnitrophica WOR_2 bacterium SM23_72]
MFKVLEKIELAQEVTQITIEAPVIAAKAEAGQFVVVILDEQGERIPLTLADWDKEKGTIALIVQKVGFTTKKLCALHTGDSIAHLLGPLGHPTEIKKIGEIYCIGGGVGIAEVYPVSRAFKQAGNRVTGIIGARTKDLVILEKEMQDICDELFITTDDGSYGRKGLVTDVMKELFEVIEKSTHTKYPALVYAIGPVPMMKAVAELTRELKIKTIVSLNPIMVDATGMCGACRCTVGERTVFGCVDGPDFDAHQVDFEELTQRLKTFRQQEESIDEKLDA